MINILLNKARYSITLDTYQGIKADPLREEILYVKERVELIIKIRKELENS